MVDEEDADLEPVDEEVSMMLEEEEEKFTEGCCPYCSEATVHIEADCVLAQTDVPAQLLTLKTSGNETSDDLPTDLTIRAGTIDALVVKATHANATGGEYRIQYKAHALVPDTRHPTLALH